MKRSNYRITLDIRESHGGCLLDMKQTDTHRRIYIKLTDGGETYPVSADCHAVFTAKKPDGTVIYNRCTLEEGVVVYDITPQTTAAPGLLACEIRLMGGDEGEENARLLTSAAFGIRVHPTVYNENDTLASETEVSALSQTLTETRQLAHRLTEAMESGAFNGQSVTHHWNGTKLYLTSAAGTSGADLRGPVGPRGERGPQGEKGEKGDPSTDDTRIGEAPWSGLGTADRFCLPFTEKGKLVSCMPLAEYPLQVVSQIPGEYIIVFLCGKNLYNRDAYPINIEGYVSRSNGKTSTSANYRRTDYIPVDYLAGQTVTLNLAPVGVTNPGMAFYDQNKVFLSGGAGNNLRVPEAAAYMIFSVAAANADGNVQLELGSVATDYEPYKLREEEGETVTIPAYEGLNNLIAYCEGGFAKIVVTGRVDPIYTINRLTQVLRDMGGQI